MDWGLGNPNKTAVLIAMLMLAIWLVAYIKRWGFWASLVCFVSLGVCLMDTASRGGLVAALAGGVYLLLNLPKPWPKIRVISIVAGSGMIVLSSLFFCTLPRYGLGINSEDPSITHRLALWRSAPRMMVDAPWGWGFGNSGRAYVQWYQPLDHHEIYRTLVNSHMTWLVEMGWLGRFLYLMAWVAPFLLCWPRHRTLFQAIPLAVWITFAVGAFFSSVAECIWLWGLPLLALFVAVWGRWREADWPKMIICSQGISASAIALFTIWAIGMVSPSRTVRGSADRVVLGGGQPTIWVLTDPKILGSDFGRTLRENMPPYSVGLITTPRLPPDLQGNLLVVCGSVSSAELGTLSTLSSHFHRLILVNPAFYPKEFGIRDGRNLTVLYGEFARSPAVEEWRTQLVAHSIMIRGAGDFVPNWPIELLGRYTISSTYVGQ
jgi:hypothetical protein